MADATQPMKRKPNMLVYIYLGTYNLDHRIQKTSSTLLAFTDMDVFLMIVLGGLGILMIMQLVGDT